MDSDLAGCSALVTGSSRGVGRLVLTSRRGLEAPGAAELVEELEEIEEQIREMRYAMDLEKAEDLRAWMTREGVTEQALRETAEIGVLQNKIRESITDADLDHALVRRHPNLVDEPPVLLGGRHVGATELLRADLLNGVEYPNPLRRYRTRAEQCAPRVAAHVDTQVAKWCSAFFGAAQLDQRCASSMMNARKRRLIVFKVWIRRVRSSATCCIGQSRKASMIERLSTPSSATTSKADSTTAIAASRWVSVHGLSKSSASNCSTTSGGYQRLQTDGQRVSNRSSARDATSSWSCIPAANFSSVSTSHAPACTNNRSSSSRASTSTVRAVGERASYAGIGSVSLTGHTVASAAR